MPTFGDIFQSPGGQLFGRPYVPTVDLSEETTVTGGNTGVGFECAKHLVTLNISHVVIACRSTKKGEVAKDRIIKETNTMARIEIWQVDLDNYSSVVAFSKRVLQLPRLDGFLANAGVEHAEFGLSEGLERTLTGHLNAYYGHTHPTCSPKDLREIQHLAHSLLCRLYGPHLWPRSTTSAPARKRHIRGSERPQDRRHGQPLPTERTH